jgi:hypothetical protein
MNLGKFNQEIPKVSGARPAPGRSNGVKQVGCEREDCHKSSGGFVH